MVKKQKLFCFGFMEGVMIALFSRLWLFQINSIGFFAGSPHAPYTDGSRLAHDEDVIVVSIR